MQVVVIPAYQPDETLLGIANQLWERGCRIIVVDDGSGETYRRIFDRAADICTILRHSQNRGKGAAIKTALAYIQTEVPEAEIIGIMDADGQHLAEDMSRLFACAKIRPGSLVLGVRTVGKDMPLKSRLGNRITRMVFGLVSGVWVSDTQTGLRAFDAGLINKLLAVSGERYEYEMNVLMAAAKGGIPIEEVEIQTIYHDRDNSCSHFRVVKDSFRIYKDILKFTLSSFSSFVVDYVLFTLMMLVLPHTAVWVFAANLLARVISAFYNYSMNCRFVFCTDSKFGTAAEYFGLAAVIFLLNVLILETLVQLLYVPVYPAKLLTECLLFCISFLIQNYVIFRKGK
ncbi:MAG: bifunctional glycosyltransferase family 2/GtrA family protein [Lachnospiraceae bacterium]|nr:bifunctional glycosyltransferase family 2/GtrA family protein [Lachnospiraceae bacterium]